MKSYKVLLGLTVISHLTGCAALLVGYAVDKMVSHVDTALENNVVLTEPKDGKRARIRVVMADNGTYLGVRAYPNSECTATSVPGNGMVLNPKGMGGGFEVSLNDQSLNMPTTSILNNEGFVKAEIYATAHQPISFVYKVYDTAERISRDMMLSTTCFVRASFTPTENADYQIIFAGGNKKCYSTASQLTLNKGIVEEKPVPLKGVQDCEKRSDESNLMRW